MKFCKFVGNSYPHISANFCTFILKILSNGVNFSMSTHRFHRVKFWVLNADASWERTWRESHHFQLYPDKGWKLSTGKKVCSRVDYTASAVLRKPGSGTRRPATAPACAVCRFRTIFPLVGPTKNVNSKKSYSYRLFTITGHRDTRWGKNDVISVKLHFHFLGE